MAALNDIIIYKGEDVELFFTMDPVEDIATWTITMTVRINATDTGDVFTVTPATLEAPTSAGVFSFVLPYAQTNIAPGDYAYDVQRVDLNSHAVLSIGVLRVTQEVLY